MEWSPPRPLLLELRSVRDYRARRNRLTRRRYQTIMGSSLTIPVNRPVHSALPGLALSPRFNPMKGYEAELTHRGFNKWWITRQNLQVIAHSAPQKQLLLLLLLWSSSSSSGLLNVSSINLRTTHRFVRTTPCFFIPRTKHTNQTRNPRPSRRPPRPPAPNDKACHCCFL